MKKFFLIVFVFMSSVFISQAKDLRSSNDYSIGKEFPKQKRQTGTVKWFDTRKAYGIIKPDNGSPEVYVHLSAVQQSGMVSLVEGQRVSYEIQQDPKTKRLAAINLKPL